MRKLVTMAELSELLTMELQSIEDAEGSIISVSYLYRESDSAGCNWSDSVTVNSGPKASADYLAPYVAEIVARARQRYNIKT